MPALRYLLVLALGLGGGHYLWPVDSPASGPHGTEAGSSVLAALPAPGAGVVTLPTVGAKLAFILQAVAGKDGKEDADPPLLVDLISKASALDLAQWLAAWEQLTNEHGWRSSLASLIGKRWVLLDAPAALAWAQAQPPELAKDLLQEVLVALATTQPEAALAFAQKLPPSAARRSALEEIAQAMAKTQPQQALRLLQDLGERGDSSNTDEVFRAWAGTDPAAAARAALAQPNARNRRSSYAAVLKEWGKRDPAAAAASVVSLTDSSLRWKSIERLIDVWSTQDPAAALAWLKGRPERDVAERVIGNSLSALASKDPAAAVSAWSQLSKKQRADSVGSLTQSYAAKDLAGAMAWAQQLTPPDLGRAWSNMAGALDCRDPNVVQHYLQGVPTSGPARIKALRSLGDHWFQGDAHAALGWVQSLSETERADVIKDTSAIESIAQLDPRLAATFTLENAPQEIGGYLWDNYVVSGIIDQGVPAAITWADSLEQPKARKSAYEQIYKTWASNDAPAAIASLERMSDPQLRADLLERVAENWAQSDPAAALTWGKAGQGPERMRAVAVALQKQAAADPVGTAATFQACLPMLNANQDDAASDIASEISEHYFKQDHAAAVAWTDQLPGGLREAALGRIASEWVQEDPLPASQLISSLPAGAGRDAATVSLVSGIVNTDPEGAYHWAASMTDPESRLQTLTQCIQIWKDTNPTAARAAVLAAPLSPEQRAEILQNWRP